MTLTFFELYTVYIQNQTHVKKVGTSQNFSLAFIDELEKSEIILIFTMSHFFRKKKKKINWRYHYQNFDDMIYSS